MSIQMKRLSVLVCLAFWLNAWLWSRPLSAALPDSAVPSVTNVTNPAQNQPEVRVLELGKPIERELAGGQSHAYQVTLTAGQYLNVVVEQRGIDVAVEMVGPDGKQMAIFDSEARTQGQETVTQVAEVAGSYRMNVQPKQKDAAAGHYEIRLVELRAATEQDRTLQEARKLYEESGRLLSAGKHSEARPLVRHSLELREQALGPDHPDVAQSLHRLATIYDDLVDLARAEPIYQRALAIREKALGLGHPDVSITFNRLAALYGYKRDYAKAVSLYQRALAISEKSLEQEPPDVGGSFLIRLAILYAENADFAKAEVLLQRRLTIAEKRLGTEHPDIAGALYDLGTIYIYRGDYVKAEPLLQRALTILEKARGPEHPDVVAVLTNLGGIYSIKGDSVKAEQFYQRTLTINEKEWGPEDSRVAHSLLNLGSSYAAKGDYAKAEPLYQRALTINEKGWGLKSDKVAVSLGFLASLYHKKGDYLKAEPLLHRALAINEEYWGTEHPNLFSNLSRLALLYEAKGELTQAINFQGRASAVSERVIALNLATGSEREKLAYLANFSGEMDHAVSLHLGSAPTDPAARNLAMTLILQRKGRALDAMTDSLAALRRRANPQDQTLIDQYQKANAALAKLVLNGPQTTTPAEHQRQIKALEAEKEKVEAAISQHSNEFRVKAQPVTLAAVQAVIPADAALVEFAVYRPYDAKYIDADKALGKPRYVAYVLRQQGEAQWVELGEAKAIDEAIEKLRHALRDKRRRDVKQLARAVDEKVMQPVRALLGQTRRVLLSPDGTLNLIPFAALVDERNRYLIQRYSFSYLTSGRDLLRLQVKQPNKQTAMVIANPDFGATVSNGKSQPRPLRYQRANQFAMSESFMLANAYFPPLSGTAGEAQALKKILPDATVLTQAQATEAALKQVSSPQILHIATHGFFLEHKLSPLEETRFLVRIRLGDEIAPNIENPLLRSGLALAGANLHKSGDDDGILTALEVAGLDLWGTKLVVLSACDTGVGEVKNGDGVYGLRRALVLAGAESQVMSLWPVSDKATRDLMIAYYTALQQGEGRSEALRQVQLRMLSSQPRTQTGASRLLVHQNNPSSPAIKQEQRRDYRHPYYWASFIQSGEWRRMD